MATEEKKPLLALVDGSNYLYRAFFGIPLLNNSKGFPTNAIYGFAIMLLKLLREISPDYIAVIFDTKGPTLRHEEFADYKASRKPMPDDLIAQVPLIKEVVRGFSIPVVEKQGVEADDVIGTLTMRAKSLGWRTVIVSGDKDLMQLIDDSVTMIDTMKDKSFDAAAVMERFGVTPDKVVDVLALTGDVSDNIPGVPGIGPKTAQRLIEEHGSLAAILESSESLRNVKLRESLRRFSSQARLSYQLATIRKDVDLDFELQEARRGEPDREKLIRLFSEFEFSSLLQQIKTEKAAIPVDCTIIINQESLAQLREKLMGSKAISLEFIWAKNDSLKLIGVALRVAGGLFYLPFRQESASGQLKPTEAFNALSPIFINEQIKKYFFDLKTALTAMDNLKLHSAEDLQLAAYLLNPSRQTYPLEEIVWEYLQERIPVPNEIAGGKPKAHNLAIVPIAEMAVYAGRRAEAIFSLATELKSKLEGAGATLLYHDVEMPLLFTLASMEKKGVLIDADLLKRMSVELGQLLSVSEEKIFRLAGEKFNINSPKQLQSILFEKLRLERGRKTKEGYSTDVDVLTELAKTHELPAEILAYRSLAKLKSTYVDALPTMINSRTGRIHTSYNQTVTATGRLSSSNPNLQNIPIRTPEGKRIRQAFIAAPGFILISADYSQVELRVLAHLSEDDALIEAFVSGEDIHNRTAADVFGVFPQMVNADMRRQAKVINFGILYGMSAFGLAKELGVSQKVAQNYIDGYFARYRKVRAYLDGVLKAAQSNGFVCTLLNRRRYLPDLKSPIPAVRQFAERMAINTPIQGTAADLIKAAMVNVDRLLSEKKLAARLIMQVHDELVLEVPLAEKEEVMDIVKKEMEGVVKLKVPLVVDIAAGANWDEAHQK